MGGKELTGAIRDDARSAVWLQTVRPASDSFAPAGARENEFDFHGLRDA